MYPTTQKQSCTVRLKHFSPVDTPVLFIPGEKKQEEATVEDNPLNALMDSFTPIIQRDPVLCMNAGNEIIQMLIRMNDPIVFQAILSILYVQSLLMGKYPVNNEEMNLFNESLYQLIVMGMSDLLENITK